jgi:Ca2+-binding RTX toxin-like protein
MGVREGPSRERTPTSMHLPSRRTRVALLAGCATLGLAGTASADPVAGLDGAGKLTVNFAGADQVTLGGAPGGVVTLNGVDTAFNAADVKTIEVLEDAAGVEANTVDLSAVSGAAYTQLTSTLIKATGGNDTLTGTQRNDRIEGGTGADNMNGADGDDTLVWNNGEGSDVMNGGDGVDTIENNGANAGPAVDETYTVETNGPRFLFKRTSTGPFSLDVGGAEKYVNNLLAGNDKFSTLDPAAPVTGIAVTLNGGDGNDALTGTDGNDTLNGGGNEDTIVGFKGNDAMNGDDGNDTLVWNNGDGSDKFEGGAGADTAVDNGANTGNDHFIVGANGARITATRDNLVPFFLDIGTTEALQVNGQGGDDSIDVNNGVGAVAVAVNGGEGNDSVRARNDSAQTIDGGNGTDTAQVDATDQVTNVESIDAPGGAADKTKPKAKVLSARLKVKDGKARVRVSLPAGESVSKGKITIVRDKKVVGTKKITMGAGTKTFKVQLKRSTRIALAKAKGKKLKATLKIKLTDAAGNTATVSAKRNLKG